MAEKELAARQDPSFDSVSSHYPAMKNPREVISVKDHRDEFIVMPDGRLNFTPSRVDHWRGHTVENSGNAYFALGDANDWLGKAGGGTLARKRLLDGYLPIVTADFEPDSPSGLALKCEQTAVAWSEGMSADEPLWAFLRLKVSNASERQPRSEPQLAYGLRRQGGAQSPYGGLLETESGARGRADRVRETTLPGRLRGGCGELRRRVRSAPERGRGVLEASSSTGASASARPSNESTTPTAPGWPTRS